MRIATFIKSVLRKLGFDLVRHVPELQRPFPVLPLLVREFLRAQEAFFFVQVGANDGLLDDSLHDLIVEYRLSGLMIEPQPHVFEELCRNYQGQPNLLFENVAVSTKDGTAVLYCAAKSAPLPRHCSGLASFNRGHLVKEGVPEQYIEQCEVPVVRLNTLLSKRGIDSVDLLQIDVEGYDHHILKTTFESCIYPRIINYEHCHLTPRVRVDCKRLLGAHGYRFIEVGKDTLAVRQA